MGLRKRILRSLEPLPGPTTTGRDPYRLLAYFLGKARKPIVFDVGCNEGLSTAKLLRLLPHATIHGFEPSPATAGRCRARFANDPRITIHQQALGSAPGQMTLHTHAGGETDSLLADGAAFSKLTPAEWAQARERVTVEVETVDRTAAKLGLDRIDLLKSDAQGFDDRVLEGARGMMSRSAVGVVYTEMIFAALYAGQARPHALISQLEALGFRLVGLFDVHYETGPAISWCDALFIHESRLASANTPGP